ncbi:MAG: toxin-antitoxin system HicB family antitoxin, partial [Chloroflexi bacterium]
RIPDDFHREIAAYADSIGVSLNQLALIALKDYLTLRSGQGDKGSQRLRKPKRRR